MTGLIANDPAELKNAYAQSSSNDDEISAEEASRLAGENNPALIPVENSNGRRFGNANRGCILFVINPGVLGTSIESKELSSKLMNGRSGNVQVYSPSSNFSVTLDAPLGFSAFPAGGSESVVMSASFLGQGDTNFSERDGTSGIRLKRGLTNLQTHLSASRSDGMPFPAGTYAAELTVRCE